MTNDRQTIVCDFCDEFEGGQQNSFARLYGSRLPSRVVAQTETFVAIPSIGQIVQGYLLVIPRRHVTSTARLTREELGELDSFLTVILSAVSREYRPPILFEHGVANPSLGNGCGVYHAHMHVVPVELSEPLVNCVHWSQVDDIRNLSGLATSDYLYLRQHTAARATAVPLVPSQFMRRRIAEELGRPNWDWRTAGRETDLVETYTRLRGVLS